MSASCSACVQSLRDLTRVKWQRVQAGRGDVAGEVVVGGGGTGGVFAIHEQAGSVVLRRENVPGVFSHFFVHKTCQKQCLQVPEKSTL